MKFVTCAPALLLAAISMANAALPERASPHPEVSERDARTIARVLPSLERLAASRDASSRVKALDGIENLPTFSTAGAPLVTALLSDPEPAVRAAAARRAAKMAPEYAPLLPALCEALSDRVPAVQDAALKGLGQALAEFAQFEAQLGEMLPRRDGAAGLVFADALWTVQGAAALKDPQFERREGARVLLAHLERLRLGGGDRIAGFLEDPAPAVRAAAVSSLRPPAVLSAPVVESLRRMLGHADLEVRRAALKVSISQGAAALPLLPELIRALEDPDVTLREDAVIALSIGPKAAAAAGPLVASLSRAGPGFRASEALASFGPAVDRPLTGLVSALDSPDRDIRVAALVCLRVHPATAVLARARLIEMLSDPRDAPLAAAALGGLGPRARVAVSRLESYVPAKPAELAGSSRADAELPRAAAAAAALIAIDGRSTPDRVDTLIVCLDRTTALERVTTARTLVSLGREHRRAFPVLLRALRHSRGADFHAAVRRAIDETPAALVEALRTLPARQRNDMLDDMARAGICPRAAISTIIELAHQQRLPDRVRAVTMLAHAAPTPEAVRELAAQVSSADWIVRLVAAEGLTHMGPPARSSWPALHAARASETNSHASAALDRALAAVSR